MLRLYWRGPGSPSPEGAALRLTYWARRPAETLTERGATFWVGRVGAGVSARDVAGVVEQSLLIGNHLGEFELAIATHAGSARSDDVGSSGGVAHRCVGACVDGDTAVDDGYQVGVGQRVEDGPGPWPVDAGED